MTSLTAQTSTKIYISQVSFTPQSVVNGASTLQNGMIWGIKVGSFVLSMFILAAIVHYILDTGNSK